MIDFIKKAGLSFWFAVASAIMTLVMTIVAIVITATPAYAISGGAVCIALGFISFLLIGTSAYLSEKFGSQHFITAIARIIALVLLCVVLNIMISERVDLISALFTWDSFNRAGWNAFYVSVVGLVFLLLAVVALIVGSFLNSKEKNNY